MRVPKLALTLFATANWLLKTVFASSMWNVEGSLAVVDHVMVISPPDVTVVEGLLTVRDRADKGKRARAKMEDNIANRAPATKSNNNKKGRVQRVGSGESFQCEAIYLNTHPHVVLLMLLFSFLRLHGVLLSIQKDSGELGDWVVTGWVCRWR